MIIGAFFPRCQSWLFLFSLLFVCVCSVFADTQAVFYVSPTGNDSNPGTELSPFQTLDRARDAVDAINDNMSGDIFVYLRGGTYNIFEPVSFGPEDSGSNGYRIYYAAYPEETPVLNGGELVTG